MQENAKAFFAGAVVLVLLVFAPALCPGDSWKFWPTLAGAVAIGVIAGKEIGTAVAGRDTDCAQ
jgi:hypothetical protein